MLNWINTLNSTSFAIQIGANDHSNIGFSGAQDVIPLTISKGWNVTLIEPVPYLFSKLHEKYKDNTRVQILQKAICPRNGNAMSSKFYYVDASNRTGNWGTDESDARCITATKNNHYLLEIGSFSVKQLLRTQGQHYTPNACRKCSEIVGRHLPTSCLKHVVWRNVRHMTVDCVNFTRLLHNATKIDLLFIDAEGYDDEVLYSYPFETLKPTRIVFEPKHMSLLRFNKIEHYLKRLNYKEIKCVRHSGTCIYKKV